MECRWLFKIVKEASSKKILDVGGLSLKPAFTRMSHLPEIKNQVSKEAWVVYIYLFETYQIQHCYVAGVYYAF